MKLTLRKNLVGSILDIGGGGEGIIGRIYGAQVIAIDRSAEELEEAPDGFKKCVMDAASLAFHAETFDCVTSFYTLMYMRTQEQQTAIAEAARVLKQGGELHIWDADIVSAYPEPFCVDLQIDAAGEWVHTTYGICKPDSQSAETVAAMCEAAGLTYICREMQNGQFYLRFVKQDH